MSISLTALHWVYLLFIFVILGFMIRRRDTSLICIVGLFILGLLATNSLPHAIIGIFNGLVYATKELMGTIFIISIIYAMSQSIKKTEVHKIMISPFTRLIKTPTMAYWIIGLLMMIISWFFWPSPAVALMGAVLLPVALEVGLPAMGVAIAMNIFGHGIALSGDFIIQGAPKLTADAAGIPVNDVVSASIPLVIVMGVVTTVTAFWFLKRDMKKGMQSSSFQLGDNDNMDGDEDIHKDKEEVHELSTISKRTVAILIPILFLLDVIIMITANLQGGDATALIGGTAIFLLFLNSMLAYRSNGLEQITTYLIQGLKFGFRVFGPVIPIAAFFYMGDMGFVSVFGDILPSNSTGLVNDLGIALANTVPLNKAISTGTLTVVGTITGLDGSGFSGISLAGSVAKLFATAIGSGIATLTALGQIAAIWVGGGTLVPWALIPVAAICDVSPFDLAKKNLKPVIIGLIVTTIVATFLI